MKLFAIYIGGDAPNSLIELHDVRFAIADRIEDTYEQLKASWWGTPESLHLDCWGVLTSADGHNISLQPEPYLGEDRLWFVNLGGYDPQVFEEKHKNVFVVAPTMSKAKTKALKMIADWKSHHKDAMMQIEQATCLNDIAAEKSLYIHLEKTDAPVPFTFTCGYRPIGKNKA